MRVGGKDIRRVGKSKGDNSHREAGSDKGQGEEEHTGDGSNATPQRQKGGSKDRKEREGKNSDTQGGVSRGGSQVKRSLTECWTDKL